MHISRLFLVQLLALLCTLNAQATLYWDTNGSDSGSGGPSPSGTWDLTSYNWNDALDTGDGTPTTFANNFNVIFSAGTDATDSYTITVDNAAGQVVVNDMHCDDGAPTLTGEPLMFWAAPRLISALPEHTFTINCPLANDPSTTDAFHKYKMGTLVLGATNTYHGATTIEGGTLTLACDGSIPATSDLILDNGDDRETDGFMDSPPTFSTAGHSQTLGMLILTGPNSLIARTIDFNGGEGTLWFANSSSQSWQTTFHTNNNENPGSIPLIIANYAYGKSKLRFGTSSSGLTTAQLAQVRFPDFGDVPGKIDALGFVTPSLPILTRIGITGGTVEFSWNAIAGRTYQVQYKDSLNAANWNALGSDLTATGDTASFADSTAASGERFYRVVLLP